MSVPEIQRRLKTKEDDIAKLNVIIQKERLEKINDDNKHEIALVQLAGSLDSKNQEIDWLTKYGEIPINKP